MTKICSGNKPLKSLLPKTTSVYFSLTLNIHHEVNETLFSIILSPRLRLTEHILSRTLLIAMAKRRRVLEGLASAIKHYAHNSRQNVSHGSSQLQGSQGMQSYLVPEREQKIFDTLTTIHSSITTALTAAYRPMSKFLGDAPFSLLIHAFNYLLETHNWIIS